MARIKRILNFYDFPDYKEFIGKYNDDLPSWYYAGLLIVDKENLCRYCGKPLPISKKELCSELCHTYYRWATHDQKINSMRRNFHKFLQFACQKCNAHLSYFTPAGVELPIYSGEVDHIIPLQYGGKDLLFNMQLLCENCHDKKTEEDEKHVDYEGVDQING